MCWLFSSCSDRGLRSSCSAQASHCVGFSCFRAQVLGCPGLSSCGTQLLVAPQPVRSSQTREQSCVPCIGRQILNHWTTREVQTPLLLTHLSAPSPRCSLSWAAWLSTFEITSVWLMLLLLHLCLGICPASSLQQLCASRKHLAPVVLWC